MRLTLRTLLAYMDGILEPEQQAELEQQVQASPEAKELVHRARDTMRRLRLGAPADTPSGAATPGEVGQPAAADVFDANAVAEYLDNTAAPQEVMDLELSCLKSDMHLAEVAACHHILTMVLAERADVDPETRRRMYAIPEAATVRQRRATDPPETSPPAEAERAGGVPDYLREGRRGAMGRWAAAAAALLILCLVSYQAFRQGGWLNPPLVTQIQNTAGQPAGDQSAPPPAGDQEIEPKEAQPVDEAVPTPPTGPTAGGAPDAGAGGTAPEAPPAAGLRAENVDPRSGAANEPIAAGASPPVGDGFPAVDAAPDNGLSSDGPTNVVPPTSPTRQAEADRLAGGAATGGAKPGADEANAGQRAADPAGGEESPPAPSAVGLLLSPQQVLLRFHEQDSSWRRLPLRTAILSGDRLLSLPTYHPTISLESGLNVELVDGSELAVAPDSSDAIPRLTLRYGRLIVTNISGEQAGCTIRVGPTEARVRIAARRTVAVEADRPFVPGVDPARQPPELRVVIYAPSGGVEWAPASGGAFSADSPTAWRIDRGRVSAPMPLSAGEPRTGDGLAGRDAPQAGPDASWIAGRPLTLWEREATDEVQQQIEPNKPVWPQLATIFGARLKEQRALAAVSSAYVGHFDPFTKALGEPDLRHAWDDAIATLRSAMARSPENAQAVSATLVELQGPTRGADLYQMLVGYGPAEIGATPAQWSAGPLRQLIEWLRSPHLEYRALANHNLEQITGRRGVFNPTSLPPRRELAIRKLEARLAKGELRPQTSR